MNELTQRGIIALKSGNKEESRRLLENAIQQDAKDIVAWLWLSGAVDTDEEREKCLRKVLDLDPGNIAAARGLAKVLSTQSQPIAINNPTITEVKDDHKVDGQAFEQENHAEGEKQIIDQSDQDMAKIDLPSDDGKQPDLAPVSTMPRSYSSTLGETQPGRLIFRTRPSIVLALIFFWIFFFGSIYIATLISNSPSLSYFLGGGIALVLEIIVLYVILRNLRTRYELTSHQLSISNNGRKANIPVSDIYHADCTQGFFQKIIGCGDILIDGVVKDELAHITLRDVPDCKRRVSQIKEFINI